MRRPPHRLLGRQVLAGTQAHAAHGIEQANRQHICRHIGLQTNTWADTPAQVKVQAGLELQDHIYAESRKSGTLPKITI